MSWIYSAGVAALSPSLVAMGRIGIAPGYKNGQEVWLSIRTLMLAREGLQSNAELLQHESQGFFFFESGFGLGTAIHPTTII